ncbi:ABC transporter substrate-binding protein [Pseudodesulfovibrio senegalensis]|nr:ABC transporter substrate-binding protein [Pseudodesulfovibrio senegalensis]
MHGNLFTIYQILPKIPSLRQYATIMKTMKIMIGTGFTVMFCCLLLVAGSISEAWAKAPIRVTFIAPTPPSSAPFWNDYVAFMNVAAKDLGIELTVAESNNRFEEADNVKKALHAQRKPDYLIHIYQASISISELELADKAGVKTIIVNTSVVDQDRDSVGFPREKFPHWIGHIYPDDREAGKLLMDLLIKKARDMGLHGDDNTIHAIGLGGNRLATSSIHREEGMKKSLENHADVELKRYVLARWDKSTSYNKTRKLLALYPETKIVWTVNDHTAMGALHAMEETGIKAGKDVLVGGIDWSQDGIEAMRNGCMVASVGGHFMEGAWALIMILDYQNGHDFADPNPTLRSHMTVIDAKDINAYASVLDRKNWKRIDFTSLSKTYNPNLTEYDFSPNAILKQLEQ